MFKKDVGSPESRRPTSVDQLELQALADASRDIQDRQELPPKNLDELSSFTVVRSQTP